MIELVTDLINTTKHTKGKEEEEKKKEADLVAIFQYKQKYALRLILLLICGVFAAALFASGRVAGALVVGLIFVFFQVLILIHYLSKRLVADDQGLRLLAFWKMPVYGVAWEKMVEASTASGGSSGYPRNAMESLAPFAGVKWLAGRTRSYMLKIIVKNEDPIFIDINVLKNGSTLPDIVRRRVRFVHPPGQ